MSNARNYPIGHPSSDVCPTCGKSIRLADEVLDRLSFRLHAMCKGRAGGALVWAEINAAIEEAESKK